MNPVALNLSRPAHLDREARNIRINAIQSISFETKISRDWDEICREEVEGNHQRADVRREFRGN